MGDAPAFPEPTLGYRWMKANVYGGLVLTAVDLFLLALARMLAVNDPDTSTVTTIVFLVAGSILTAYGVGLWGRLIGAVLSRRLPLLPVRTWIALHAFMGLVLGLFVSMLQTIPETDSEPTETAATATILVGMTIVGLLLGALGGALQALVLRKAARSVGAWVRYSVLAGALLGPAMLVVMLGPQADAPRDLFATAVGFIAGIVIAAVMLPAVRGLQARDVGTSAVPHSA